MSKWRCSYCSKYHRGGRAAHRQSCRICGGDERWIPLIEDVDLQYLCSDAATHGRIAQGFGDADLVRRANPPVIRRTKKPGKAQSAWIA